MKIAAVIVTFNRSEKLIKTLDSFAEQSRDADYLIVVNNGSTDGTAAILQLWREEDPSCHIVINNPKNLGGAGGFYTGLECAQKLDVDWIWISDDDAYPEKNALQHFTDYLSNHGSEGIAVICSEVISYHKIAAGHRRRIEKKLFRINELDVPITEYEKESFDLDIFSYVGAIIKKDALLQAGLPEKDYFIQWDDSEHSLRVGKYGRIICVPSIKVYHDIEYSSNAGYQWKDYYLIRNRMDAIRRNLPPRYYWAMNIKRQVDILKANLKPDKEWAKLFKSAVQDARNKRLGIHELYKPGWKPAKDLERIKESKE
jgi:GT2 family glycosyltransferase